MHQDAPTSPAEAPQGPNSPTSNPEAVQSTSHRPNGCSCCGTASCGGVGGCRHSSEPDLTQRNRADRVQREIEAGRQHSDAELETHRDDCRFFMEQAAARWQIGQETRATVDLWMRRFMGACELLSPQWKAARETQILAAAAGGPGGSGCYFADCGDRDRAKVLAANEGASK